jgi:hypothetical protein
MRPGRAFTAGFIGKAGTYGIGKIAAVLLLKKATESNTETVSLQIPQEKSHFLANSAMALGGLGMAGAGLGAYTGNKIQQLGERAASTLTPEGKAQLEAFMKGTASNIPDAERLGNFIEGGHDLLNKNIFNVKGKTYTGYDVLDQLYKNPLTKKIIQHVNPDFQGMNPGTREHYREFSKSPLDAYRQLVKEQFGEHGHNSYMKDIHDKRMNALYKARTAGGKGYLQHLADEFKFADMNPDGLGREIFKPSVPGDAYFKKALKLEAQLRRADPHAYAEWLRVGKVSNAGGILDEQAMNTLKSLGEHLYGKANFQDIAHDPDVFWKNLKAGMREQNIDGTRIQEIIKSKDFSKLTREEQSKLLKHLINSGPKLQSPQLAEDIAKSFSAGRAGYRGLAGGALKLHELATDIASKGKKLRGYGKYGLGAAGGLAGLGLLSKLIDNEPEYKEYKVTIPRK